MRSLQSSCFRALTLITALLTSLFVTSTHAAISERTFHQVLDLAERVYMGEFLAHRLRLQLSRNWDRDEHRASASQQEDRRGKIAVVSITGGIARDPSITRDAFALIVCHEFGHHLAGAPHRWGFSAEGQADYFAASECLRRLLPLLPDYATTAMHPIPRRLETECASHFSDDDEAYLCLRIAVAGEALSRYLASRRGLHPPNFLTPDSSTVVQTRFPAASPQCRLDTYRAGALCNSDANRHIAPHLRWLCTDAHHPQSALRPACWFRG